MGPFSRLFQRLIVSFPAGELRIEFFLKLLQNLADSFFGISLQSRVNGCMDAQPVRVQVVWLTGFLQMGGAPFFHFILKVFPEIDGKSLGVRFPGIIEDKGLCFQDFRITGRDVTIPGHLVDHQVSPFP